MVRSDKVASYLALRVAQLRPTYKQSFNLTAYGLLLRATVVSSKSVALSPVWRLRFAAMWTKKTHMAAISAFLMALGACYARHQAIIRNCTTSR